MKNAVRFSDHREVPLISIIIPVYKVEPFLERCVESVIHQTYSNLEIILVDDGSPDQCGQICDRYAEQDDRIHVIHQKNKGLSAARNAGMEIMTGEFCFFLDSDDHIEPHTIALLLDHAKDAQADLVIGNFVRSLGNQKTLSNPPFTRMYFSKDDFKETSAKYEYLYDPGYGVYAWNKLYRNRFLQEDHLRFDEQLLFGEDMVFSIRCFARYPKIQLVNEYTYYYCIYASTISKSEKKRFVECGTQILECIQSELVKLNQMENNQDLLAFVTFGLIHQMARNIVNHSTRKFGDIRRALIQFRQSKMVAHSVAKIAKEPVFRNLPRKKWAIYARMLSFFYHHKLHSITALILYLRFQIWKR